MEYLQTIIVIMLFLIGSGALYVSFRYLFGERLTTFLSDFHGAISGSQYLPNEYTNKEKYKFRQKRFFKAIALLCITVTCFLTGYQIMKSVLWNNRLTNNTYVDSSVTQNLFLTRDLENYFEKQYEKRITVKYELLRDAPTKMGVADPKYYIWITLYDSGQVMGQGAARVAMVNEESFEVTHYFTRDEMIQEINIIYKVFPKEVGDKIKEKLEN